MTGEPIIVVGLGFGDEGKGGIVDYLCRSGDVSGVVRFNGGPQAAHNVVTPDGRHHTFAQFGSGTFVPDVRTHLSRFMLVNPLNLIVENEHLRELGVTDAMARLSIDASALVVTPFHIIANRAKELARGAFRHGSCGQGIGEARGDYLAGYEHIVAADLLNETVLRRKMYALQFRKLAELKTLRAIGDEQIDGLLEALADPRFPEAFYDGCREVRANVRIHDGGAVHELLEAGDVVFEGAQGVLLDERHGWQPHTTWTNTLPDNAYRLLADAGCKDRPRVIGVTRTFMTRHGAGPLPTELDTKLAGLLADPHNEDGPWQGPFRVGYLDLVLLEHAAKLAMPTELAVTHTDRLLLRDSWPVAVSYRKPLDRSTSGTLGQPLLDVIASDAIVETIRARVGRPVVITSGGFTAVEKTDEYARA